jgi:hypothetical protein
MVHRNGVAVGKEDHAMGAAEPWPPWLTDSSVINILPLKAKIKHRESRPPTLHYPFELKITFCGRGVISPVLSNVYLTELDKMLEKAIVTTRRGKYTQIQYARFAVDLLILISSHPQQDWVVKAVEKRLREESQEWLRPLSLGWIP